MSVNLLPQPLDRLEKKDRLQRTLKRGEVLFVQDSATVGLYYLVSGTVSLTRTTNNGHSVLIHRACAGTTFAEASVFSDSYHCTATAVCESVVIECRRDSVAALLDTDIEFTRSLASQFAGQIQEFRRRVELLSIRSADERILAALHDGLLVEDITTFADMIGLAPETVYRSLAQFTQDGLIEKKARGKYQLSGSGLIAGLITDRAGRS